MTQTTDTAVRVEHMHVGGSGGAPGECSAECACGVTFDGFDSIAEAAALLDRHIADETGVPVTEPAPVKPETRAERERREYVAGLRQLAELLETHTDLEVPYTGHHGAINVILSGDAEQREQIAAWTRAMRGTKTKDVSRDGSAFYLYGQVGGLKICIIADREEVCQRVVTGTREVTEEIPDPEAVAALPIKTVTRTEEIVEWVCSPVLDDSAAQAEASA